MVVDHQKEGGCKLARYLGPSCKLCRREGIKLFLKGERCYNKCTLDKKSNLPRITKAKPAPLRISPYLKRMREKQKLKRMAGISETQMRNYYLLAKRTQGLTGENLLKLLETRLDNVVYRLGFAPSRKAARQLITHEHVLVNGKKVKSPGYRVKINDEISLEEKMKNNKYVLASLELLSSNLPSWLSLDREKLIGKVLSLPSREEISFPVAENLIVEFYSR